MKEENQNTLFVELIEFSLFEINSLITGFGIFNADLFTGPLDLDTFSFLDLMSQRLAVLADQYLFRVSLIKLSASKPYLL